MALINGQRVEKRKREYPLGTIRLKEKTYYTEIKTEAGWRPLHRIVAEEKYGRSIEHNEQVHHLDGDRLNNHPDNIVIIKTTRHMRLHTIGKKLSAAHKKKIGETLKGHPHSNMHNANVSKGLRGHIVSPEQREKIRRSLTGRTQSPERKERHSVIMKEWWRKRKLKGVA